MGKGGGGGGEEGEVIQVDDILLFNCQSGGHATDYRSRSEYKIVVAQALRITVSSVMVNFCKVCGGINK